MKLPSASVTQGTIRPHNNGAAFEQKDESVGMPEDKSSRHTQDPLSGE